MDRFYMEKLLDDMNRAVARCCEDTFETFLTYFAALDHEVDPSEQHLKQVRYLISVSIDCPVKARLAFKEALASQIQPFAGRELTLSLYIGFDEPDLPQTEGSHIAVQVYMLDDQRDHAFNKTLLAGLLPPSGNEQPLPPWFGDPPQIDQDILLDALDAFCAGQLAMSRRKFPVIRHMEAGFQRLIKLGIRYFQVDDYESLVKVLPPRYQEEAQDLPEQWSELLQTGAHFDREQAERTRYATLRFCNLLAQEL